MARLNCGVTTEGAISIASNVTKTLLQLAAPTNQRAALKNAYISFDGVTATDKPAEIQLVEQSTAGTMSAATEFTTDGNPETPQVVAQKNATVEPTTTQIKKRWYVYPQAGYERIMLPGVDEYEIKGGGRLGLVIVSPSATWTTVNAIAGMEWEE